MSLAQGNNTPTRPRIEPGSPDPESDALTTRPVRSPDFVGEVENTYDTTKARTQDPIAKGQNPAITSRVRINL